jgi:hypothetical protein
MSFSIAGVTVRGFSQPAVDGRVLQRSIGEAASGSTKIKKFRDPDRLLNILLKGETLTTKNSLATALLAAQTTTVAIVITSESHIDLGNGAAATVNVYWLGPDLTEWKEIVYNNWEIPLLFKYSS